MSAATDYNYSLRLPASEAKAVRDICERTNTSFNSVIALCVRKALPDVRVALGVADSGRVTNVDPMPARQAKNLYALPDDDADAIRMFMQAQSSTTEE